MELFNTYFVNIIKEKYFAFDGRARRKEYWYFVLFNFIISAVLSILCGLIFGNGSTTSTIITGIYSLALLLPGLGLSVRRLHDIGKSGWWILIAFVPIVGAILILVWACKEGDRMDNVYGPDPKAGE